jgi:uracil-DNA glycosylase family 4
MSHIFINYRRQDTEGYVGRLYDHLIKHFDPRHVFIDIDNIKPGADFVQVLEDAVNACDVLIAMIGPQWLSSVDESGNRRLDQWNDFVRIEIATALKQNKMVIPVLVGRARMPSPAELPEDLIALARRNALELSHQRFSYDADKLINLLKEIVPVSAQIQPQKAKVVEPDPVVIPKPAQSELTKQKDAALKMVRDDLINATTSPLYEVRSAGRYFPVLGDGNSDANIMFIGESPGKTEAAEGRPFCGPSGEILDEMLKSIGLTRQDVFVTNIVLDYPGAKREPFPTEIAFYTPFADRIIDIIQPKVIVPLGRFSMNYILKKLDLPEKGGKISDLHGKLIKTKTHYGEIHVVPLYHPAVVLYSASQKEILLKDFQRLKLFS